MVNMRSDEMPNLNVKLSHQEKRSLAWKILFVTILFVGSMFSAGLLYRILAPSTSITSTWFILLAFTSIAMFGIGYLVRDGLPSRMNARCRRFYYMGKEFNIWHWKRSQVFLADIFLVTLGGALYAWSIANTIIVIMDGYTWWDPVPMFYLPFFYFPLWIEFIVECALLAITLIGFIYEAKTWLLGSKSDLCHFEGFRGSTDGTVYKCDPSDINCNLNDDFPL